MSKIIGRDTNLVPVSEAAPTEQPKNAPTRTAKEKVDSSKGAAQPLSPLSDQFSATQLGLARTRALFNATSLSARQEEAGTPAEVQARFSDLAARLVAPSISPASAFAFCSHPTATQFVEPALGLAETYRRFVESDDFNHQASTSTRHLLGQSRPATLQAIARLANHIDQKQQEQVFSLAVQHLMGRFALVQHRALRQQTEALARAYLEVAQPGRAGRGASAAPDVESPVSTANSAAATLKEETGVLDLVLNADLPHTTSAEHEIELPSPFMIVEEQARHQTVPWSDNVDVMALATLVLMDGAKAQEASVRELLNQMQQQNQKRAELRALKSRVVEDKARIRGQLTEEFQQLSSTKALSNTVTLEQYLQWREVDFSGLDEGASPPAFATPEVGAEVTADLLPSWLKSGSSEHEADKTTNLLALAQRYQIPHPLIVSLNQIYVEQKQQGVELATFADWLSYPVCLTSTGDAATTQELNREAITNFLERERRQLDSRLPPIQAPKVQLPNELTNAMRDYATMLVMQRVFPQAIDPDKLEEARRRLLSATQLGDSYSPALQAAAAFFRDVTLKAEMDDLLKRATHTRQRLFDRDQYHVNESAHQYFDPQEQQWLAIDKTPKHRGQRELNRHLPSHESYDRSLEDWSQPSEVKGALEWKDGSLSVTTTREEMVLLDGPYFSRQEARWRLSYSFKAEPPLDATVVATLRRCSKDKDIGTLDTPLGMPFDLSRPPMEFMLTNVGEDTYQAEVAQRQRKLAAVDATLQQTQSLVGSGTLSWPKPELASGTPAPSFRAPPASGLMRGSFAMYEARTQQLDDALDGLSEQSEVFSLRLQRYMEARGKLFDTLSQLQKSQANLSKSITENTK